MQSRARWDRLFFILLMVAVATGCSLCERGSGDAEKAGASAASLATLVPAEVDAAFFVDDWKSLRDGLSVFERRFGKQMPIEPYVAEVKRRFGLDLRDIPDLSKTKGIRTAGGLGLSVHKNQVVIFIPIENAKLFEQYVAALGKDRLGAAPQPTTKEVSGHKLTFLQKAPADAQAPPATITPDNLVLAYAIKEGTAIVYPGKELSGNAGDAQIVLTKHLKLTPEKSLVKTHDFDNLKAALATDYPVIGYINAPSAIDAHAETLAEFTYNKEMAATYRKMASEMGWTGVGLSVKDEGLHLHVQVLAKGALKARIDSSAKALASSEMLSKSLDTDPALALKLSVHPNKGYEELRTLLGTDVELLDEALGLLKRQFQVDVATQLLPTLDGNILWAIYEAPPKLLRRPDLSLLLHSGRTTITLGLKDRPAFIKLFEGVAKNAGPFVKRSDHGDVPVFTFEDTKPTARLAIGPKAAVLASAKITPEEAARLATGGGGKVKGAMTHPQVVPMMASDKSTGVVIDPNQLDKIIGQTRAASPFEGLDLVMLTLQPDDKGAVVDLRFTFKPEKAAPKAP